MTPLRRAEVLRSNDGAVELGLEGGWKCRVSMVAEGVGRVFFTPPEGLREERTWSIAPLPPGGGGAGGEGGGGSRKHSGSPDKRLPLPGPHLGQALPALPPGERGLVRATLFAKSMGDVSQTHENFALSGDKLRAKITLEPFAINWEQWNGSDWLTCCKDRPTYA